MMTLSSSLRFARVSAFGLLAVLPAVGHAAAAEKTARTRRTPAQMLSVAVQARMPKTVAFFKVAGNRQGLAHDLTKAAETVGLNEQDVGAIKAAAADAVSTVRTDMQSTKGITATHVVPILKNVVSLARMTGAITALRQTRAIAKAHKDDPAMKKLGGILESLGKDEAAMERFKAGLLGRAMMNPAVLGKLMAAQQAGPKAGAMSVAMDKELQGALTDALSASLVDMGMTQAEIAEVAAIAPQLAQPWLKAFAKATSNPQTMAKIQGKLAEMKAQGEALRVVAQPVGEAFAARHQAALMPVAAKLQAAGETRIRAAGEDLKASPTVKGLDVALKADFGQ